MKHAIMVIGFGNDASVLQKTISILDDKDIDFFIHWDIRYKEPILNSKKSKIIFIKNRVKAKWGSYMLIKATLNLMKDVTKHKKKYDYVHLISCNDLPLMTASYFKNHFKREVYIGFQHPMTKKLIERINFYYPNNVDYRKHAMFRRLLILLNRLFRVNRLNDSDISELKKGSEWFSVKYKYILEILNSNKLNEFTYCLCGDEMFVQTILGRFDNSKLDENQQSARYIDWNRGRPYVFNNKDVKELKNKKNTMYAFVRKVKNAEMADLIFDDGENG